jgi:hypothetical protein
MRSANLLTATSVVTWIGEDLERVLIAHFKVQALVRHSPGQTGEIHEELQQDLKQGISRQKI